jgi:hypothetical protein
LCIILVALISGLIVFRLLCTGHYIFIDPPHKIADFANIRSSLLLLFKQLGEYAYGMNAKSLILFINLFSFCGLNFLFFRNIRRKEEISLLTVYYLFSIVYTLVVLFMPVINGNYTGYDTLRYNIYVLYLGIFNIGVLLYDLFRANGKKPSFISFVRNCGMIFGLYVLVTGLVYFSPDGLNEFFIYTPKTVQSLDEKMDAGKYKYGVANYWDAKLITLFSKKGLKVYSVQDNLVAYPHVANENWYLAKNKEFNYFVINHVADTSLYSETLGTYGKFQQLGDAQVIFVRGFTFDGGHVRQQALGNRQ